MKNELPKQSWCTNKLITIIGGRGGKASTDRAQVHSSNILTVDRAEQRLRMCKGCGGLGSKMVSICMGLVREVNILSISDAVPAYLT